MWWLGRAGSAAAPRRVVYPASMRRRWAALWTMSALTAALLGGCGDQPEPRPKRTVDPALVGLWDGEIAGSLGSAEVEVDLAADGGITSRSLTNPNYCPLSGDWWVAEEEVQVRASDCDASQVQLSAPYDTTRLSGRWSSSSGNRGTFELVKR